MDHFYTLDLRDWRARGGSELVCQMRAAVGKVKREAGGACRLTGIALDRQGARLMFCFRLDKK